MKAAESLFEFMPYGAPELLQSRRERLASALLLSSLGVAASFIAAGGLARLVVVPPVEIPVVAFDSRVLVPPPVWSPPRPQAPAAQVRATKPAGVAVPVPHPDAPLQREAGPTADPGRVGTEPVNGVTAVAPPADEALPLPDEHVWAEEYPVPVTRVTPGYPPIARDAGVEGLVIVKVLVGKTGRVLDARLDQERQVPMLNEAALAAARQWVFTPALASGRPVAVWTAIPFHFRLH